jgi:hypothetical protein
MFVDQPCDWFARRFLDCGAQPVRRRTAMAEDLGEEFRCRCGAHFQAGLAEGVLRHGQGMTVRVQIAGVLQ